MDELEQVPVEETVPVGCVLAFAADLSAEDLAKIGWLYCHGQQLSYAPRGSEPPDENDYYPLFLAIGHCNGGGGADFFLPDYRGLFLRGSSGDATSSSRDPGVSDRFAAAPGGNTKEAVGSLQWWATARPNRPFLSSPVDHAATAIEHSVLEITSAEHITDAPASVKEFRGGDAETAPTNVAVHYIIKWRPGAAIPVGAVFPFAGVKENSVADVGPWFCRCNGTQIHRDHPTLGLPDLFEAIGYRYGGSDRQFSLPDYRGRFLRGLGMKTHPQDASKVVRSGTSLGAVQASSTARPVIDFTYSQSVISNNHAPANDFRLPMDTNPDVKCYAPDGGGALIDVNLTDSGGDTESRPSNVAMRHYIVAARGNGSPVTLPIGSVICIPGDAAPPGNAWTSCDNTSLDSTDPLYHALFDAIDYAYGRNGRQYAVPDLRGQFLRDVDEGSGHDPDVASRMPAGSDASSSGNGASATGSSRTGPASIQSFATGSPSTPIRAKLNVNTWQVSDGIGLEDNSPNVTNADAGIRLSPSGGGDVETRPANASVTFYIKSGI